jgi:hypothetical protein
VTAWVRPQERPSHRPSAPALLLATALAVASCGHKAPARPPRAVAPIALAAVAITTTAEGARLSWERPETSADGSPLTDLAGFVVQRSAADDAAFTAIAVLEVTDHARWRRASRFAYLDTHTTVATASQYRVVSFTRDGYFSEPSNVVSIASPPLHPTVPAPN